MNLDFTFGFHPDGLDILYGDNLFGYATSKKDFFVLDLDDCYNNSSPTFLSCFDVNLEFVSSTLDLDTLAKRE